MSGPTSTRSFNATRPTDSTTASIAYPTAKRSFSYRTPGWAYGLCARSSTPQPRPEASALHEQRIQRRAEAEPALQLGFQALKQAERLQPRQAIEVEAAQGLDQLDLAARLGRALAEQRELRRFAG